MPENAKVNREEFFPWAEKKFEERQHRMVLHVLKKLSANQVAMLGSMQILDLQRRAQAGPPALKSRYDLILGK
jgi:hypothetical protein